MAALETTGEIPPNSVLRGMSSNFRAGRSYCDRSLSTVCQYRRCLVVEGIQSRFHVGLAVLVFLAAFKLTPAFNDVSAVKLLLLHCLEGKETTGIQQWTEGSSNLESICPIHTCSNSSCVT